MEPSYLPAGPLRTAADVRGSAQLGLGRSPWLCNLRGPRGLIPGLAWPCSLLQQKKGACGGVRGQAGPKRRPASQLTWPRVPRTLPTPQWAHL